MKVEPAEGKAKNQGELFGQAKAEPPPWEAEGLSRVERVIAFVESLECTAGMRKHRGKPLVLRPWQRDMIEQIYAEDEDGGRPVRTAVLSLGRKNGKTALAAALALCHLAGPEAERRGECYSAANDRNQAAKLFKEMLAMVQAHPLLSQRISARVFNKELEDLVTGSVFAALSADASTKQGLSPSFVVYDELGSATGRALFDALDTAMGAREDPLFLVISTQAATDAAPMSELVDYGLQVQAGAVEDQSFKLFFYSAPMDADPWSEEAWRLANPALDDFLSLAEVKRQAGQAQRIPSKEAAFRNLILNQRVSADAQFLTVTEWMRNAAAPDLESLAGKTCYAGLDLSASRDLTALVLAFPDEDGHFDVVPFFWLPGDGLIDREHEDRMPYGTWKRQGQLLTTPGNTIDPGFVAAKLAELEGLYDIRALGYDRWRIEAFKRELDQIGSEVPLEEFGQGYKDMAPAVDLLERLVAEGRLRHGSHPILTWNIANTVVTPDPAGNRKLDKARSRGRIDGAVALAMALSVAEKHSSEDGWEPFVMVV